jgi:hypothetical protein
VDTRRWHVNADLRNAGALPAGNSHIGLAARRGCEVVLLADFVAAVLDVITE